MFEHNAFKDVMSESNIDAGNLGSACAHFGTILGHKKPSWGLLGFSSAPSWGIFGLSGSAWLVIAVIGHLPNLNEDLVRICLLGLLGL